VTQWKSLAGKFDSEEIEVIKQFQKELDLNDNQFLRKAATFFIFFVVNMTKLVESKVDEDINREVQQIKKEVAKYPELNAKVQPFLKKMEQFFDDTLNGIIEESEPDIKKFTKIRFVGRPKSQKKNRGRPKDTGI